ncbi:unnamed protein product, partial [Prorocentrum cordatum]
LQPTPVRAYGFKTGVCVDDVVGLVRQILFLADSWGFEAHVCVQDVLTAFDSMPRESTFDAMRRRGVRPGLFYKNKVALQTPGNLLERIRAWRTLCGASVTHGACNWHLDQRVLKRLRTWELQVLRSMLKMRRRPHENQKAYNQRAAAQIYAWFGKVSALMIHHR